MVKPQPPKQIVEKSQTIQKAKLFSNWDWYKSFQKQCKRSFERAEQDYIIRSIDKGLQENNNKPFWRYIKNKNKDNIGESPLKQDGTLQYENSSKADILLKQFKSVFTTSDGIIPKTSKQYPDIDDLEVTEKGVCKLLQGIDVKKAVGPDSIPNIVLRKYAKEIAPGLKSIFNKSLQTDSVPKDGRDANTSRIIKKGNKHLPVNYRPVSLTSVSCKLLEHIICKNILTHFDTTLSIMVFGLDINVKLNS